ncbi:hypothetical protein F1D05_27845 [Kribbella qitaiheensis]|uniref:Uncharacterized protein n=1 Tax=Kribbella qitaiheensis TaxID=1544730 RepID=A0A7G6X460_9ACTN|nr:hypothetical protein [Kribbella qitaiheensis]QNE21025.1 hypothetical protein F1D05_27845 [Kribbella qitaiheensis]
MRKRRTLTQSEDTQYCVFCDAVMLFEQVEAADHPLDDPAGEWICVACGTALLIGPPQQYLLHHTA